MYNRDTIIESGTENSIDTGNKSSTILNMSIEDILVEMNISEYFTKERRTSNIVLIRNENINE